MFTGLLYSIIPKNQGERVKMFYTEKERKINAVKTDVLIVGSGPAGIGAAISASRLGVKVTVVEKTVVWAAFPPRV